MMASTFFPLVYPPAPLQPLHCWLSCQIETKGGYLSWPGCRPNPQCPDYCSPPLPAGGPAGRLATLRWDKEKDGDVGSGEDLHPFLQCTLARCCRCVASFVSLPLVHLLLRIPGIAKWKWKKKPKPFTHYLFPFTLRDLQMQIACNITLFFKNHLKIQKLRRLCLHFTGFFLFFVFLSIRAITCPTKDSITFLFSFFPL